MYFTDAEFVEYNNTVGTSYKKLPTLAGGGNADPNIANLRVKQFHGIGVCGSSDPNLCYEPSSYTGSVENITPVAGDVGYDPTLNRGVAVFKVTGFSGFFVYTDASSPPPSQCWVKVSTGLNHTLAIKADGTLWGWGSSENFQLGTGGGPATSNTPIQIGTQTDWLEISAAAVSSYAIKQNGTLWAWGSNNYGQLGLGNNSNAPSPNQIGAGIDWKFITATGNRSFAIKQNGSLWAWGYGADNYLGLNDSQNKSIPTQIGNSNDWNTVSSSGTFQTIAIKGGKLFTWGHNGNGALGNGTTTSNPIPTQVGNANWIKISAGELFSLGIQQNGTLWAWGTNTYGQLGDGTTVDKLASTQIGYANDWIEVEGSSYISRGIRKLGYLNQTLWGWGRNYTGELGAGNVSNVLVPTQNGANTQWGFITHGAVSLHSVWLDYFGRLYSAGFNFKGQLGDGINVNKNTLTYIASCSLAALPITLTSFTAKNQTCTNLLNWTTENEINNQYFEIQHSNDGTNFKPIGKVNGQLNSSIPHSYDFTHNTPGNRMNYYRLKQVDVDDKFTFSKIEKVNNTTNKITIYPNPVTNELYVKAAKNNMPFSIVNNVGQTVLSGQHQFLKPIPTIILSKGIYFLKMDDKVIKFLKQ